MDCVEADMVSALPDDMLLEVFKRLPPPTGIFRCAAVSHRWRRVAPRTGVALPAPPRHFGFFRNYGPSPLPPFVPTTGAPLDLRFLLPVLPPCGGRPQRGHLSQPSPLDPPAVPRTGGAAAGKGRGSGAVVVLCFKFSKSTSAVTATSTSEICHIIATSLPRHPTKPSKIFKTTLGGDLSGFVDLRV